MTALTPLHANTRFGSWLDASRNRRMRVVSVSLVSSIAISFGFTIIWDTQDLLKINDNLYVAAAGLIVAALAIERITELLIAPWVGVGDRRLDRNIIIGTMSLVLGVVLAGILGLRFLEVFQDRSSKTVGEADTIFETLASAVDLFATGFAISAGSKPLHDLISRLEKSTEQKKEEKQAETATDAAGDRVVIHIEIDPLDPGREDRAIAALPGWTKARVNNKLFMFGKSDAAIGTATHTADTFSALLRLSSANIAADSGVDLPTDAQARVDSGGADRRSLALIGVTAALQRSVQGARGVRVAVIDTGINDHPHGVDTSRVDRDAGVNVLYEQDGNGAVEAGGHDPLFSTGTFAVLDIDAMGSAGHGTGVAAVIAAGGLRDATTGAPDYSDTWWERSPMIGVAPEATVVPFRVMRGPVHIFDDDVEKGVRLAVDAECQVISLSLGGFWFNRLEDEIKLAVEAGCIVVCASGNEFGVVVEPASYPQTVAVASVDLQGQPFVLGSSRGPSVHIAAPGVDIARPDFDEHNVPVLAEGIGTTYATAHIAGVAALWLKKHEGSDLGSKYEGEKMQQLFMHVLQQTATKWPNRVDGIDWGAGVVDVSAVLDFEVLDANGEPTVADAVLASQYRAETLTTSDRIAGGIAAVLAADGTLKTRFSVVTVFGNVTGQWIDKQVDKVIDFTTGLWDRVRGLFRRSQAASTSARRTGRTGDRARIEPAIRLMRRELVAQRQLDTNFKAALAGAFAGDVNIPAIASKELKAVLGDAKRSSAGEFGLDFSSGLRRALRGEAQVAKGYRWIGVTAVAAALAIAVLWGLTEPEQREASLGSFGGFAGLVGLVGIGLYGAAQVIERLLEYTIGRWAFRDVPGREADRALILLGSGILIGTLASILLDVGLMAELSRPDSPNLGASYFIATDSVVTGLAIGGGAKPVHDLLERIRVSIPTGSSIV